MQLPSWFKGFRPGQEEVVDEIVELFESGCPMVVLDAPTGTGKTIIAEAVRQSLHEKGLYLCHSLTLQDQFSSDFDYAAILKGRSNYKPLLAYGGLRSATCADCDKTGEGEDRRCSYCDPVWSCPYEISKRTLLQAKLGNTNIRYFLTEANHIGLLSRRDFTILDECDVLEAELMNYIQVEITARMRKFLDLPTPKNKTVQKSWVEWFERVIPRVTQKLIELEPSEDDTLMDKRRYLSIARVLEDLRRVQPLVSAGGFVYDGYQYGTILFKPVEVAPFGQKYIWNHSARWLCMSATIISPEEFVASTGYEGHYETVTMPSPFDKARRPIKYAPAANMTHATREEEWPKMAEAIGRVIDKHPDERILVHTNSYALANTILTELSSPRVRAYLDAEERGPAIEWYESTPNAVLLASSLDRGYDGVDDLCRVVVIAKLPFPNIGDKQIQARLFDTKGGKTWFAVQTARSLVQMSGRGMRHEDDFCVVYVLDKQFERFWRTWRKGSASHKLLPKWFCEAIQWGGAYRQELVRG